MCPEPNLLMVCLVSAEQQEYHTSCCPDYGKTVTGRLGRVQKTVGKVVGVGVQAQSYEEKLQDLYQSNIDHGPGGTCKQKCTYEENRESILVKDGKKKNTTI